LDKSGFNRKGVICENFGEYVQETYDTSDYMATSSRFLFGDENTVFEEMSSARAKQWLNEAPYYFAAIGHGMVGYVQTSSTGGSIDYNDVSSAGSLLMEIAGCWVGGWHLNNLDDPWGAEKGSFPEAGLFGNAYTITMVLGIPENGIGHCGWSEYRGFAGQVLSEMAASPGRTLGELMIGKERCSSNWVLYGDPTLNLNSHDQLCSQVTQLQERVSTLESEAQALASKLEIVVQAKLDLEADNTELVSRVESLRAEIEILASEGARLKDQVDDLASEIETWEGKYVDMLREMQIAADQLDIMAQEKVVLQGEVSNLTMELGKAEANN